MTIDVATWIIFPGKNPECDPVLSFQMRKMKTQVNHQPFHNITKIQLNCDKRWQKDDQHSVLFPQLSSSNRLAAAQESSGEILMTSLKPPENWSLQLSRAALIQFAGCFFPGWFLSKNSIPQVGYEPPRHLQNRRRPCKQFRNQQIILLTTWLNPKSVYFGIKMSLLGQSDVGLWTPLPTMEDKVLKLTVFSLPPPSLLFRT